MIDTISKRYLDWMIKQVQSGTPRGRGLSYYKLFKFLDSVEFRYNVPKDRNRFMDGVCLRDRFIDDVHCFGSAYPKSDKPCSVLEMMVALAIRCEENIMSDEHYGDRTSQWFWGMVNTLGLGWMDDDHFDLEQAQNVIDRFLNQEYSRNGKGGLFYIRNCRRDVRKMEIWTQMCHYLDTFNEETEYPFT